MLQVSQSLYCFTTFICHGVENYFPRLWGTGISDAIFSALVKVFINSINKHVDTGCLGDIDSPVFKFCSVL